MYSPQKEHSSETCETAVRENLATAKVLGQIAVLKSFSQRPKTWHAPLTAVRVPFLPHISNLKISLIMGKTDFSLNTASVSPETVIKHLERTTEFKCELISTQGFNIDKVPDNLINFLKQPLPLGVNNMLPLGKDTVRINFDPKAIGARTLVNKSGNYACQLALSTADSGLAAGS
ncbi:heavy metal translocatin [Venturia nashicola]|nr:heavy metal translocatin [Venturia nashicola]